MFDHQVVTLGLVVVVTALLNSYLTGSTRKLKHIPSVGYTLPILSHLSCLRSLFNTRRMIRDALTRWPGSLVKLPGLSEWMVIASSPGHIEDLRKAPENVLSADIANNNELQIDFTLGPHITQNPYHLSVLRAQFTRSIHHFVPELHDELLEAFKDLMPPTEGEPHWSNVKAFDTVMKVVARAANRSFVGLPLCRNPEWMEMSIQFMKDVLGSSYILRLFPSFMRPLVAPVVCKSRRRARDALKLLQPFIEERRKERREKGDDYSEKAVDFLSFLMDDAEGIETQDYYLTSRVMALNFASMHTSSMTFTHALYFLAANPGYLKPLREEVEEVTAREGWTKDAVDQMYRIDSFVKESQRVKPVGQYLMLRYAVRDFTFSDGTTIPAGTSVAVLLEGGQESEAYYEDPHKFDGLRFAKMRERALAEGQAAKRFDMVTLGPDFLAFGHGRHACPGRYFAAVELKLVLAHIVMFYDVRTVEEGVRPKDFEFLQACAPNMTAELMFRKRRMM